MANDELQKKLEKMRTISFSEDERQYLQMMQDNISRMASNSANCKNWLIMIVAALFAMSCDATDLKGWLFLLFLPIGLFWWLDAYYLKLERGMRNRQRLFLNICSGIDTSEDYSDALFNFSTFTKDKDDEKMGYKSTKGCWKTESVRHFYVTVSIVVLIIVFALNFNTVIGWF